MIAKAWSPARRTRSSSSGSGAGITVSGSLRAASGSPAAPAQAISDETPGTTWTAQASGTTNDLSFVTVLDTNDVYAFGAGGTVVHYDGKQWSLIPITGVTATLRAVDFAVDTTTGAITDYFLVGDGGTILHSSDGASWSPQSSGTTVDLFGVTVSVPSNGYAVGALGTILHYNGTSWTKSR